MRGIYETKSMFVLYHSPWMAWILPKRFFWNDERLVQQWREWAIRQLPERKRFHEPGLLAN
jgi:YcxB-like protein